jgi:hypothetical protein
LGNAHPLAVEVVMHGLDPTVSVAFLLGRKIEQICIGTFQSQIQLDEDVVISVEGALTLDNHHYDEPLSSVSALVSLLGTRIIEAKNPGTGDLELRMASGSLLIVHDSKRGYESYSVTWKGGTLVV